MRKGVISLRWAWREKLFPLPLGEGDPKGRVRDKKSSGRRAALKD
jgi:hypothetical protein